MITIAADRYGVARAPVRPGLVVRAFRRLVAARQAQADRAIASYLLGLGDIVHTEPRGDRTRG